MMLLLKQWMAEELAFSIENIYIGLQNGILVPKIEPFIVLQKMSSSKLQTPVVSKVDNSITELVASIVQIDFYRAAEVADKFYLYISSYVMPSWGNFIDFSPPSNLTGVDSTERFLQRSSIDVTISHYITTTKTTDTFDAVVVDTKVIQ